jgi:hypothetical protein
MILASSCDVERGFSRGGLTVTKLRHALSDDSTRASTLLHAWSEFPELIPTAKIIQIFKDKPSRTVKEQNASRATTKEPSDVMDTDVDDIVPVEIAT